MTALSFTISTATSLDKAGLPLEGLPPLEAGRTLPQAFAELLGEAAGPALESGPGKPAPVPVHGNKPVSALSEGIGETPAPIAKDVPVLPPPGGDAKPGMLPAKTPVFEPATGKALPVARPETAASKIATPDPLPVMEGGAQIVDVDPKAGGLEPIPVMEAGPQIVDAKPKAGTLQPIPVMEGSPPSDKSVPQAGAAAQQIIPTTLAQQLAAPVAIAATGTAALVQPGAKADASGKPAPGPSGAAANDGLIQKALPGLARVQNATPQGGTDFAQGNGEAGGDAQADQAAQQSAHKIATAPAATGKAQQDAAQTGLSLQIRAAEKPVLAPEAGQPVSPASGTSPSSAAIAAPLPGAQATPTPIAALSQNGPQPHFPELAALVDRIAAARESVGSASATIALAHKELGNLSLTFETTGRTLDVEVAAQDNETQRSLAAALAADRPQLRASEAQTQGPGQSQANQSGQANGSAQGGQGDARHSGQAGDARDDRRDQSRQARQSNSASDGQGRASPDSGGGIYA